MASLPWVCSPASAASACDARVGLERGVVGAGRVVDEVEQRVDAVGEALAHGGDDAALARDDLRDAEAAEVLLVLRQRGSDHGGARRGRQLDGEAADAAGRAGHEQHVALVEVERVDGGHGGDPGQRRGPRRRQVDAVGHGRDRGLLGDGDQLGPGAVARGRVGVRQEAEDLVAGLEARHGVADLLDHAGVVAAEGDRVLVLDAHLGEHPGGDRVVDRVGGGGVHAHEHVVGGRGRGGQVRAEGRSGLGAIDGDGAHGGLVSGAHGASEVLAVEL
jgi:hypothetical protein